MPAGARSRAWVLASLSAAALACRSAPHLAPATPGAGAGPASPSATYGEGPEVALQPLERRTLELVRLRLATREGARPRVAPSLVLAARELARRAAGGAQDPIGRAHVRAALARAAAFDPAPAAVQVRADPDSLPEAVANSLSPSRTRTTHVGVGIVEQGGFAFAVLLASDRTVRLAPFPRDVVPGQTAVLSGTLSPGLSRPRVFVTLPSGLVAELDVVGTAGFRAPVTFRDPGRHVVEVTAEGDAGPEVAALLVVASGGASLDLPGAPAAAPTTGPAGDTEAEASVLRAIGATRRRQGLPPLESTPALDAVARRHSAEMARAARVAHVLPGSGDVGERLRRAGLPYRRAYENVARAETALVAHETAEESPAHLANVLRPDASLVGIGVARARLASGGEAVYLTEIFVTPPDDGRTSRLTPEARVREALWRERARLRLSPLTSDAALDAAASDAARSMRARDETDAPELARRALALGRDLAAVDLFVASAPDEAIRSANLQDRRFGRVGVGVAMGDSRRFGAGRYWIAVVYTD